jgi:hypothetical protein
MAADGSLVRAGWPNGRSENLTARTVQTHTSLTMTACCNLVTQSRFERRLPRGRHDLAFKVAFGSDAAAAKYFKVRRMQVWRWRHDRAPLPERVLKALPDLLHAKVAEAHLAQTEFGYFLREPPKPPRRLSGCCAGYGRKLKTRPRTDAEWTALGY